jgi:hypothetical protein
LYIKTPSFYQDRLGTNIIGKSQKADRFLTSSLVKKKRKKGQSAAGAAAVDWASEAHPIGEFVYQTFTSGDFNIFLKDFASRIGDRGVWPEHTAGKCVSRNRFCDFLADPDSRSFSRFYLY